MKKSALWAVCIAATGLSLPAGAKDTVAPAPRPTAPVAQPTRIPEHFYRSKVDPSAQAIAEAKKCVAAHQDVTTVALHAAWGGLVACYQASTFGSKDGHEGFANKTRKAYLEATSRLTETEARAVDAQCPGGAFESSLMWVSCQIQKVAELAQGAPAGDFRLVEIQSDLQAALGHLNDVAYLTAQCRNNGEKLMRAHGEIVKIDVGRCADPLHLRVATFPSANEISAQRRREAPENATGELKLREPFLGESMRGQVGTWLTLQPGLYESTRKIERTFDRRALKSVQTPSTSDGGSSSNGNGKAGAAGTALSP